MSGEDDLLRALGRAAREERAGDAARVPVDEARQEAMVDAALAALGPTATRRSEAAGRSAASVRPAPARPRRPWIPVLAATLAAAAAAALFLRPRGPEVALPSYQIAWEASGERASEWRAAGDPGAPPAKVKPDDVLTITLRPEVPTSAPLEARVFVTHDHTTRRVEVPVLLSQQGVARVSEKAKVLFDPPSGEHALVIVLGPKGAVPEGMAEGAALRRGEVRVTFE